MFTLMFQHVDALEQNEIVFPKLGLHFNVNSTAFTAFGFTVTWYGVLIAAGMLLAMLYGFSRMRKYGLDPDRAVDGVIGGVLGGIVGARIYYVVFHWSEYSGDFKSVFNIRGGGLAIYGGVIGALLVGSLICKLRKVRLLPMFDITALGFLIGQCIGRWGNFTNHEAFGSNTDWITGMSSGKIQTWIASNYPDGSIIADETVHPCFFYESLWCLLGFLLLHFISKKYRKFDGQIFLMYVIWYGTGRFFIEGLRTDSLYIGTVKVSQLVALLSAVTALVLLLIGFSRVKRMGTDYVLYVNSAESKALLEEADRKAEEYAAKHGKKHKDTAEEEEQTHVLLADDDSEPADAAQSGSEPEAQDADTPAETAPAESTEADAEPAEEKTPEAGTDGSEKGE